MGKRGPKPKPDKRETKILRVDPETAMMISAICRYTGKTSAELIGEIMLEPLKKQFETIRPVLEQLAKNSPVLRERLDKLSQAQHEPEEPAKETKPKKSKS